MLFVDSREKPTVRKVVEAVAGPIHVRALESADFLLFDKDGHSLGVERKTVSDFLGSIGKKMANGNARMADQLDRMRDTYTHRLLFVEGTWAFDQISHMVGTPRRMTGWNASAVALILWGIQYEQTYLIPTASTEHTAEVLRVLHERSNKGCVLPKALKQGLENAA